nr:immunoglobulin heavy chain junction region [Macaca mulatta]MOW88158.1 immunoglobulin heavy chain junction region [Macaca mulatta]MOW88562.1 immunoglobulin heavy chain junction region [Macaca mulatta]MOW89078.1 immunoglobulin heavy chain junction region [Macaca mulatta]MOW92671.1 immunoglobulin heavy chain junction region [Macaca mulatta]
SVRVQSNFDYW